MAAVSRDGRPMQNRRRRGGADMTGQPSRGQVDADQLITGQAGITDMNPDVADMERRVARFSRLKPTDDYVDATLPGCERTTWRVIGVPPAAPLQAEGFHLNLVHCDPGKSAPLHNHLTQEVFFALSGRWEVFWGPQGERAVTLEQWDTITIPPGLSRGFRNVGESPAWLLGMASGQDPGMINWPESVRAAARAAGVSLPGCRPGQREGTDRDPGREDADGCIGQAAAESADRGCDRGGSGFYYIDGR